MKHSDETYGAKRVSHRIRVPRLTLPQVYGHGRLWRIVGGMSLRHLSHHARDTLALLRAKDSESLQLVGKVTKRKSPDNLSLTEGDLPIAGRYAGQRSRTVLGGIAETNASEVDTLAAANQPTAEK